MGYTSKFTGQEIDNLLTQVQECECGLATMMTEVTYDALVALRDGGNLIPGMKYRITDYETIVAQNDTQSAGHPFDIIVTALDSKTLDEKASAIHSARDTEGYFADSNLAAWQLMYCLDNDPKKGPAYCAEGETWTISDSNGENVESIPVTLEEMVIGGATYYSIKEFYGLFGDGIAVLADKRIPNAGDTLYIYGGDFVEITPALDFVVVSVNVTEGGKGVIYKMIDEHGNEASYDFKNVMFLRRIAFGEVDMILDTEDGVDIYCYTFTLLDMHTTGSDNSLGNKVYNNKLGRSAFNNVFLSSKFLENLTGLFPYNHNNVLGEGASGNTLFHDVYYVTLGAYCNGNVIGSCSYNITLDLYSSHNSFGFKNTSIVCQWSSDNIMREYVDLLDLQNCSKLTIGAGCGNIKMRDCTNVELPDKVVLSRFEKCSTVKFTASTTTSQVRNYNVTGLQDVETYMLMVNLSPNELYLAVNTYGEIKQWCPADLIQ